MEHKTEQQNNYGWNLTWNATGKFPIIAKRIWLTKADLEAWVNDTSDTAVEGLITGVYNDGENNGVYFVLSIGDGITDGSVIKLVNSEEGKGLSANNFTDEYKRILDSYDPESGKYDDTALWTEVNKKVDKVDGKQLSTEDFTTLLKLKLEGLSNYDDSEVTQAVLKLRTDLDTLVSGDTTTAIKTFNEVIAFLDGLEDTEDLASIIASIEQQIAAKQDTIADIATIREGAAKGATALQLEQYKGTVTSVTAGEGLEGGTITEEGTISLASLHSGKSLSLTIPPTTNVVVGSSLTLNSSEVSTSIYPRTISADKYGRITSTGLSSSATTTVKKITVNGATTTKAGFMTAADKTKLDGIDMSTKQDVISDLATIRQGASLGKTALQAVPEGYATESYVTNALDVAITNKADKTEIPTKVSQLENDANYIADDVLPNGVYAVNVSGNLIDYNTADSSCLGVALVQGEHKFMIAKSDATDGTNTTLYWTKSYSDLSLTNYSTVDGTNGSGFLPNPDGTFGGTTHLSDDFTTWTAGALSDFNGKANTAVITEASSDARDMCTVLNTFNTSDSFKDWYVPACGQLALMYLNMTEINAALAKIGGTALSTGYYWSSSENSSNNAWYVSFYYSSVNSYRKSDNDLVRFVRDIPIFKPLKERVSELESNKQDKLVSGTNIKTINGQDILGQGDIVIEGGNSEANVGAVDTDDFVEEPDLAKYLTTKPQSFTDEEKQQVKDNLGISETGGNIETLNVNVSGITEGFTVYVMSEDGDVIGSQTTNYKTYRIKEGVRYYVMAGEVEGYMAPNNSETFTAYDYAEREINMVYKKHLGTQNPSNGVYIQDVYGYCCTEDEWTGDFTPNGIAVITDNCSFVIALEQSSEMLYFGPNNVAESGVVTTDESGALIDYKGVNNTQVMVDRYPTKNYSCNYCKSYKFPNGETGYLGAAGEWNMVLLNFEAIARALEICGGQPLSTDGTYVSSTLSRTNSGLKHVWVFGFTSRSMFYSGKDNKNYTRAFTTL